MPPSAALRDAIEASAAPSPEMVELLTRPALGTLTSAAISLRERERTLDC